MTCPAAASRAIHRLRFATSARCCTVGIRTLDPGSPIVHQRWRSDGNDKPKGLKRHYATIQPRLSAEEFYRHYLNVPLKSSKTPGPGEWLSSIESHVGEDLLPQSLLDKPLDFFDGETYPRDLQMAKICLERCIKTISSNHLRAEIRKEHIDGHEHAGSKVLSWLLQDYDPTDLDMGFLRSLVHLLVVEGGESHIWDWLKVPGGVESAASKGQSGQIGWSSASFSA
ncbi:unnamed protein product [Zymoseptoria tritici ST99CH_1A5]|uniref:Uncharacterized protein n=1 Tax=Zymoseptoria tritici ST99CH_1A5 TaxID=1276529 RepID=A0A1Y6LSW1_ZYMTR|nr:unnamed protein product [Zymoseptoria tritici ST99CH_1A5]